MVFRKIRMVHLFMVVIVTLNLFLLSKMLLHDKNSRDNNKHSHDNNILPSDTGITEKTIKRQEKLKKTQLPDPPLTQPKTTRKSKPVVEVHHQKQTTKNKQQEPNELDVEPFHLSPCKHIYGKVLLFTASNTMKYVKGTVNNAIISKICYAKMRGYEYMHFIDEGGSKTILPDKTILETCKKGILTVRRHCMVAQLLQHYDYVINIDADSGVINPNHCFEEYMNPAYDLSLMERVHSGEVTSAMYVAKNTTFAKNFLMTLYRDTNRVRLRDNYGFVRQLYKTILPEDEFKVCSFFHSVTDYRNWMKCCKSLAGKGHRKIYGKIFIAQRAQSFGRDCWTADYKWADTDFLLHAMKRERDGMFFRRKLKEEDCAGDSWDFPYKTSHKIDVSKIKAIWKEKDKLFLQRKEFAVEFPGIGRCWPNC